MITNFLTETLEKLVSCGYTKEDIDWVGAPHFQIPIHEFLAFAEDNDYDAGYGIEYVPVNFIIVMVDGTWFERRSYDGSEWWAHCCRPEKPSRVRHLEKAKLDPYRRMYLEEYCYE